MTLGIKSFKSHDKYLISAGYLFAGTGVGDGAGDVFASNQDSVIGSSGLVSGGKNLWDGISFMFPRVDGGSSK